MSGSTQFFGLFQEGGVGEQRPIPSHFVCGALLGSFPAGGHTPHFTYVFRSMRQVPIPHPNFSASRQNRNLETEQRITPKLMAEGILYFLPHSGKRSEPQEERESLFVRIFLVDSYPYVHAQNSHPLLGRISLPFIQSKE